MFDALTRQELAELDRQLTAAFDEVFELVADYPECLDVGLDLLDAFFELDRAIDRKSAPEAPKDGTVNIVFQ